MQQEKITEDYNFFRLNYFYYNTHLLKQLSSSSLHEKIFINGLIKNKLSPVFVRFIKH